MLWRYFFCRICGLSKRVTIGNVQKYITKPFEMNDFLAVVVTIENFWISIVKLPIKKDINK